MAIARCENHRPKHAKPPAYAVNPYAPPHHPDSGVVCGRKGCEAAALIWLKTDEAAAYVAGQRVFDIKTNSAKVRVQ